ncbi:hypothetical protein R1sor_011456 [Riccia sorocarpa]|uniref:BZIP domain-containing protein n=1 Tax=Riccia sorocarpa TaxID=122646 RepID=A0ABD3I0W9_9MARC
MREFAEACSREGGERSMGNGMLMVSCAIEIFCGVILSSRKVLERNGTGAWCRCDGDEAIGGQSQFRQKAEALHGPVEAVSDTGAVHFDICHFGPSFSTFFCDAGLVSSCSRTSSVFAAKSVDAARIADPQPVSTSQPNGVTAATSSGEGTSGITSLARFGSLPRQPSVLSLTLGNFNFLDPSKNVGSMNMSEFLKNLWNSEEVQAMTTAYAGGTGSNGDEDSPTEGSGGPSAVSNGTGLSRQSSLARQGSLGLTVPREISRKTVEEVWRDIHKPSESNGTAGNGTCAATTQATWGEMTLEDFLFKAGVVKEGETTPFEPLIGSTFSGFNQFNSSSSAASDRDGPGTTAPPTLSLAPAALSQRPMDPMSVDSYKMPDVAGPDWLRGVSATAQQQQQQYAHHQQQMQAAHAAEQYNNHRRVANGAVVVANGYGPMAPGMQALVPQGMMGVMNLQLAPNSPASPLSDGRNGLSPSPVGAYGHDGAMRGRRKGGDGPHEKVVERRQRRMIKNRESAARSRARKQAYTVELEAEVTQLKDENNKLKRQQLAWQLEEITARRKRQMMCHQAVQKEFRLEGSVLRRTRSGPW